MCIRDRLNADVSVNGILCQLPLPKHIDEDKVIDAIDPKKDVDGFSPVSYTHLNSYAIMKLVMTIVFIWFICVFMYLAVYGEFAEMCIRDSSYSAR